MKRIVLLIPLILVLAGCSRYDAGYYKGRWEAEVHNIDLAEEAFDLAYEQGYAAGHADGLSEGYSEWYGEGYDDGSIEGYGQGYADALLGKEYDFSLLDGLVWVPDNSDTFHKPRCSHAIDTKGSMYGIEEALVLGYQYCEDCIGK